MPFRTRILLLLVCSLLVGNPVAAQLSITGDCSAFTGPDCSRLLFTLVNLDSSNGLDLDTLRLTLDGTTGVRFGSGDPVASDDDGSATIWAWDLRAGGTELFLRFVESLDDSEVGFWLNEQLSPFGDRGYISVAAQGIGDRSFSYGGHDQNLDQEVTGESSIITRQSTVPEPTSLFLLGSGALGVVGLRRRRRRS